DDIKCSSTECIIEFPRGNKGKKRLIISPYLDSSFMVLDIPVDDKNQGLAQSTYQLDAANDGSALTNFLATYPKAVIQTLSKLNSDTDIAGLWVGRLTMDDKPQLLTLAVYPDQQSNFTLHLVGKDYVNRTTFMPPDIRQQDGVIHITITHWTFANQLIINRLSGSQIREYMYSVHKGYTLQTGDFWLLRIE
ncbi:hypothetical protein, partial [Paraglaciecola sp.]|uniref:hypothetical protein n=1 Tax=Paraglaciecola sp. TaxID=1920173 RepID=UPI00273F42CA